MKSFNLESLPKAIGPYNHIVETGDLYFMSGQLGIDVITNELADGIENETKKIFENLKNALLELNKTFSHIVKTTIYLANISDFAKVNEIYASYFEGSFPARAVVEVSAMAKNASIEMDVIISR
ncbi:MAG: Rid family detoxifying hydrolase [Rickettsiales bacterium]|jgi:2-iminobutanoate/2-iminopropanoate deaminase|nr:Rid family detoxifying hydrolase [Rickettsiales bacterium]